MDAGAGAVLLRVALLLEVRCGAVCDTGDRVGVPVAEGPSPGGWGHGLRWDVEAAALDDASAQVLASTLGRATWGGRLLLSHENSPNLWCELNDAKGGGRTHISY